MKSKYSFVMTTFFLLVLSFFVINVAADNKEENSQIVSAESDDLKQQFPDLVNQMTTETSVLGEESDVITLAEGSEDFNIYLPYIVKAPETLLLVAPAADCTDLTGPLVEPPVTYPFGNSEIAGVALLDGYQGETVTYNLYFNNELSSTYLTIVPDDGLFPFFFSVSNCQLFALRRGLYLVEFTINDVAVLSGEITIE